MVAYVVGRVLREGSRSEKVAQWGRVLAHYASMTDCFEFPVPM